jgi:hypothetical protein
MFKFFPFPIVRNCSTSPDLSRLFLDFAQSPDLRVVKTEMHFITVRCSHGELRFWQSNRYYAWASEGTYTFGGHTTHWNDEMPSRYAVRAMSKAIGLVRFARTRRDKVTA